MHSFEHVKKDQQAMWQAAIHFIYDISTVQFYPRETHKESEWLKLWLLKYIGWGELNKILIACLLACLLMCKYSMYGIRKHTKTSTHTHTYATFSLYKRDMMFSQNLHLCSILYVYTFLIKNWLLWNVDFSILATGSICLSSMHPSIHFGLKTLM